MDTKQSPESEKSNSQWERNALELLLLENLKENRKARRWKALLRILSLFVIVSILAIFSIIRHVYKIIVFIISYIFHLCKYDLLSVIT